MQSYVIRNYEEFAAYCSLSTSQIQRKTVGIPGETYELFFVEQLIDKNTLHRDVLHPLLEIGGGMSSQQLMTYLPVGNALESHDWNEILTLLLSGWIYVGSSACSTGIVVNAEHIPSRSLSASENESQIFGPQVGFAESIDQNIALIRSYLNDPHFRSESFTIGSKTKSRILMCYVEDTNNESARKLVHQRLADFQMDGVLDSAILSQFIEDTKGSIFPLYFLTERPDRAAASLLEGKIVILVGGSSRVIVGPTTFLDCFKSEEDRYLRWQMSAFVFTLRMIAVFFSLLLTPFYVAALTYHYEMIPSALLDSLASSRAKVPFPPLFEALLLEIIIELLREAGARLPTKVGQTMGIVGGIVVGQAAVQAGFTSNLLIMIVALGALASYTSPGFMMGSAIRILRFPMIFIAGCWGGVGIVIGLSFLIIHLLRLTSLGAPYLKPIYPLNIPQVVALFIRPPLPDFMNKIVSVLSGTSAKKTSASSDSTQKADIFEQFQEEK
ncbi:spore germination protein [Paenibacillus sp. FJAT-26967]|uniref:spore germination protein n=1 Tax=Paenibacillus sp. FJAT-26967 TaxID=1729690 RepID=UPI0008390595|nr:spore germination protein [Paenibacillus sp. FJAT-26967]